MREEEGEREGGRGEKRGKGRRGEEGEIGKKNHT